MAPGDKITDNYCLKDRLPVKLPVTFFRVLFAIALAEVDSCSWGLWPYRRGAEQVRSIDDAVTGIPSSTRAYTIHEHCDARIEAKGQVLTGHCRSTGAGSEQELRTRLEQPS